MFSDLQGLHSGEEEKRNVGAYAGTYTLYVHSIHVATCIYL